MNKTSAEGVKLVQNLREIGRTCGKTVEIVVVPPFTALHSVATVIDIDKLAIKLGAQDVYFEDDGAFTGAISTRMLKAEKVKYVLVGHSERREYFAESDQVVNQKAKAILKGGMIPIICCGESEQVREEGETGAWISTQITEALEGLSPEDVARSVIAYEPIWAIGTGKTATPVEAQVTCELIRAIVADMFGKTIAAEVRVLYGGSVTQYNARAFFSEHDIDGALVGGASLDAESFGKIAEAAC